MFTVLSRNNQNPTRIANHPPKSLRLHLGLSISHERSDKQPSKIKDQQSPRPSILKKPYHPVGGTSIFKSTMLGSSSCQ